MFKQYGDRKLIFMQKSMDEIPNIQSQATMLSQQYIFPIVCNNDKPTIYILCKSQHKI